MQVPDLDLGETCLALTLVADWQIQQILSRPLHPNYIDPLPLENDEDLGPNAFEYRFKPVPMLGNGDMRRNIQLEVTGIYATASGVAYDSGDTKRSAEEVKVEGSPSTAEEDPSEDSSDSEDIEPPLGPILHISNALTRSQLSGIPRRSIPGVASGSWFLGPDTLCPYPFKIDSYDSWACAHYSTPELSGHPYLSEVMPATHTVKDAADFPGSAQSAVSKTGGVYGVV